MEFHPLSRSEQEIVHKLQSDGRTTKRSLAEQIGLATSTTLDKVRDLEERGVINGYHADVSLDALGRSMQAFVAIKVRPKTEAIVNQLMDALWELPETLGIYIVSGEDDILVHLGVADTQSLRRLVLEKIGNAEGVVDETTSLIFDYRRKQVVTPVGQPSESSPTPDRVNR